jgi:anthranilate phosphoribosyltransferase
VALYAANVADTMEAGIALAREALASGAAKARLDRLISATQKAAA